MSFFYNLGDYFEDVAGKFANRTAIKYPDRSYSYSELNTKATYFAEVLLTAGVVAGDVVAIVNTKEFEAYAMMVACLKVGAAYTSFDADLPESRAESMVKRCRPKLICSDQENCSKFQKLANENSVPLLSLKSNELERKVSFSGSHFSGDKIAYIMFTSGSTGEPKGVAISHQNVMPFIQWATDEIGITPDDVYANVSPMYFDNSVFDFYGAFFNGACLAPLKKEVVNDPKKLISQISLMKCTVWFSVPSLLMYLTTVRALSKKNFSSLRIFIFGGEGYPKKELQKLFTEMGPETRLLNVYGPTEGTCICSCYRITSETFDDLEGLPPLGKMNPNFDFMICDDRGEESTEGELYILGPNVGTGYYNDEERTSKSFVEITTRNRYKVRAYKTGDIVRKDSSNVLYFVGRKDNQIKHMGYRIELEEIELSLGLIKEISQSAVIYHRERTTFGKIVAFYSSESQFDPEILRSRLSEKLPAYMIPNLFVHLPVLPKNSNGKVDKQFLKNHMEGQR